MFNWSLVLLFVVGGGLFLFFSGCFCYYKRKDIIRRRQEKIYEQERDGIYIQRQRPKPPVQSLSQQGQAGSSSLSQATTPETCSSTVIEMYPRSTAESASNSSGDPVSSRASQAQVNPAFDTTEF